MRQSNTLLQSKLDKKSKELQDLNESAKTLIDNKDNLIQQYEDKINEINKDKNKLIEQNHELLDKIKNMNSTNLGDLLNDDDENNDNENNNDNNTETILLNTEIKNLKEKLANQAQDLVAMKGMEKEVNRLKIENKKLESDYKALKEKMNKERYEDDFINNLKRLREEIRSNKKPRTKSIPDIKDIPFAKTKNLEKQIEVLKRIQEEQKKSLTDEIEKLNVDLAGWKVKCLNQQYENESIILKYRNLIQSINKEIKKKGIKISVDV